MRIIYDSRVGQYREGTGKFVPRGRVIGLVQEERARLQTKLKTLATALNTTQISRPDFHRQFALTLKESHIRMAMLGSGEKENMSNAHYGAIGQKLLEEYNYLWDFIDQIKTGKLSPKQIIARSQLYAQSTVSAFWKGENVTRQKEGFNFAKRTLDPQARHCNDCLRYQTDGLWIGITDVVLPGHRCTCRGNCRCYITYKKVY